MQYDEAVKAVAILLAALTATAQAEPSEPERLYNEGQQAYDAKRFDDALVAWERSYQLSRLPGLLFNIAQAHRLRARSGDCTMAVEAYRNFIKLDPRSSEVGTATRFIAELGPCATAESRMVAPPWVAPHEPPPATTSDRGGSKRLASYAVGGGSLVLVATGLYFGSKAQSLGSEVTSACAHGCLYADIAAKDAEGRGDATKQWVFYGLGVGGLVTSGVLYWLGSTEQSSVAVVPRGDGAMATWSRSW